VRAVNRELESDPALVVGLLYGSGLRLMEAFRLSVQNLDFERKELTVRNGKGGKDRRAICRHPVRGTEASFPDCSRNASAGSGGGLGIGDPAACAGGKRSARRVEMGMVMGLSPEESLEGRRQWERRPPSSGSKRGPKGCEASRQTRRSHQTGRLPQVPPFVRNPFAGARARSPNDSGTDGPLRSQHHHGLHPRTEARPDGRHQPSRSPVAAATCGYRVRHHCSPWKHLPKGGCGS
jgi:hypothetical protein